MKGRVKWFNDSKGYGFIESDDDQDNELYFAHYSSIQIVGHKTLENGQAVQFTAVEGPKGYHAVDITPEPLE